MQESTSRLLFIHILHNGSLRPSFDLPAYRTTKSVYCLKKSPDTINPANVIFIIFIFEYSPLHCKHSRMLFAAIFHRFMLNSICKYS